MSRSRAETERRGEQKQNGRSAETGLRKAGIQTEGETDRKKMNKAEEEQAQRERGAEMQLKYKRRAQT